MAVPSSRGRSATPGDVRQAVGPPAMTGERLNQAGDMREATRLRAEVQKK